MTITIKSLQKRMARHRESYQSLINEELYVFYKKENGQLTQDQLDYLMCQALCELPDNIQPLSSLSDLPLFYAQNLTHPREALDPQFEIIARVILNRDALDICNDWCKSVLLIYELIALKLLANIQADAQQIIKLSEDAKKQHTVPLLFAGNIPSANSTPKPVLTKQGSEADEKFGLRQFTAPVL